MPIKKIIAWAVLGLLVGITAVYSLSAVHQEPQPAETRYMDVETYVKTNISELSPIKETVGGKFFVTAIETHGGMGTVEYEDGHNAYVADFAYSVDESGKPSVTSFAVRE